MKITINEKEYGLVWGIAAIDRYCTMMDMDIEPALDLVFKKGSGVKQTIALAKFVSCAVDSYSIVNSLPVENIPYEKILVEFDNQGPVFIQSIIQDFLASRLLGQSVSEFLGLVVETPKGDGKPKKKSAAPKS